MKRKEIIEQKLSVLNPHIMDVIDKSADHVGHAGNPGAEGETHFDIVIGSDELINLSKLAQHRIINNLLKEEFKNGLHALSIKVLGLTLTKHSN